MIAAAPMQAIGEDDPIWLDRGTILAAAGRFPLVRRSAPPCGPLTRRIGEVARLANTKSIDPARSAQNATTALSRAAQLASDCMRPDVAEELCWQQVEVYTALSTPLSVPAAISMLTPVTTIARLRAQDDQAETTISLLTQILRAARTGGRTTIDGHVLRLDQIEGTPEERRTLVAWASSGLVREGVGALADTGRWTDAAQLVATHHGMGERLTAPRQAVILGALLDGDIDTARRHLADAATRHSWERDVASCLTFLVAAPSARVEAAQAMVDLFRRRSPQVGDGGFRARHGVTVARLAGAVGNPYADDVARQVAAEAIAAADGRAARDVVQHTKGCLSERDRGQLEQIADRSGLMGGRLTGHLLTKLRDAADTATTSLAGALS